jgi:hypothetical protein
VGASKRKEKKKLTSYSSQRKINRFFVLHSAKTNDALYSPMAISSLMLTDTDDVPLKCLCNKIDSGAEIK